MTTSCCGDARRDAVRRFRGRTGLDFVEVSDDQRTLYVYFLGKLPPEFLEDGPGLVQRLRLEGGTRVTGIRVLDVDPHVSDDPEVDDWLTVRLDRSGDHSRYTLHLVDVADVDPMYAACGFSFKVGCPSQLDCRPVDACDETPPDEPAIHYLAKDYASFRRLIEDRLALVSPEWTERHVPDLGITLAEVLAYTGDYLSYHQDAVATEAYLDTARQRISVRRHARLVDYALHEGCNARAWVVIETSQDIALRASAVQFLAGIDPDAALPTVLGPGMQEAAGRLQAEIFEPVPGSAQRALGDDATLVWRTAHNRIRFHDWARDDCCLPKGAIRATLRDAWLGDSDQRALQLAPGDVLILREVRGPRTGLEADADPERVHAVRLVRVTPGLDPLPMDHDGAGDGGAGEEAGGDLETGERPRRRGTPVVDVEWHPADALPFPLCLSALGPAPDCTRFRDVSVAFGNVVLVDHGERLDPEPLGEVPTEAGDADCLCEGRPDSFTLRPGRVRWSLAHVPMTHRADAPGDALPATACLAQDPRAAMPQLRLREIGRDDDVHAWTPVRDLLSSGRDDRHVVAEIDNEGVTRLRFGDDELGRRPPAGSRFHAHYRIGNGRRGNVGPWSINRLRLTETLDGIALTIGNPMPAQGGTDPERLDEARLFAPGAFRKTLMRAITADDYAAIAARDTRLQRAACELVWTGSWYEADVALDPLGGTVPGADLFRDVEATLEKVRRLGHDLHVERAVYVPIDLALHVCALPGYERGALRAALLERFGAGRRRDGGTGWFHPDRLSFGDDLRLSAIVAEAMAVPGVECVRVARLQRRFQPPNDELDDGVLRLAAHEIARLDNDPDHPEHGVLSITVGGGR